MVNRKLSRVLGPILGVMGFMLAIGILETSVFAAEKVQADSEYISNITTAAAVEYKDYSVNINKSETQNGIKVTVDKAIGTRHKLKVILKVEGEKSLEKLNHGNSIFELTYGNSSDFSFTNSSEEYVNDKTMIITLEKDNYKEEYPEKGDLRVDVVYSSYKINIGMDIPVDFSNSFASMTIKSISGKIPELNYTLKEIESDVMGTTITYSKPEEKDNSGGYNSLLDPIIVLKAGDRMYRTDSNGDFNGEDGVILGNYHSESATYDKIKNKKEINIIPVTCSMRWQDLRKLHEKNKGKEESASKETTNNVTYEKNLNFTDGSKGEIYNIERNDNSIKVYCKGATEKESLLMASKMEIFYQNNDGENDNMFYSNKDISFYKDPKESLGYIVEFNDVKKDKKVELSFDDLIKYIDKYNISDEIKLLN